MTSPHGQENVRIDSPLGTGELHNNLHITAPSSGSRALPRQWPAEATDRRLEVTGTQERML